jgi:hypothetical protein
MLGHLVSNYPPAQMRDGGLVAWLRTLLSRLIRVF